MNPDPDVFLPDPDFFLANIWKNINVKKIKIYIPERFNLLLDPRERCLGSVEASRLTKSGDLSGLRRPTDATEIVPIRIQIR
jgi:hypothetical protein